MRIGFDSHALRPPFTGMGVYAWNLVKSLREIGDDSEYGFFSYYLRGEDIRVPPHPRNASLPRRKLPWMALQKAWMALGYPRSDSWFGSFDIVHGLFNFVPPTRRAKRVVTILDVAFLKHPETFKPAHARHFVETTRYAALTGDAIIAISENTKRDVVESFRIPEGKVVVTPMGINHRVYRPIPDRTELEEARDRFGLKGKVILYVGTLEPRKNLGILLDAFDCLRRGSGPRVQLVLAGKQGAGVEGLISRIEALERQGQVVRTGYVSESDAVLLYNLADVFAYPSLYEGFGIPPLEAMACGCPVVASNTSSLPEVVGDAGILSDPRDPDALAEALRRVLTDDRLREEMRARGIARAQDFTWERAARGTLRLYESLLGS